MFWHADWSLRSNERMMGKILSALFSVSDTNFSLEIDGAIWSCEENILAVVASNFTDCILRQSQTHFTLKRNEKNRKK